MILTHYVQKRTKKEPRIGQPDRHTPPDHKGGLRIHQTNLGKSQTESLVKEHPRPLSMVGGKLGRSVIELSNFEVHYSRVENSDNHLFLFNYLFLIGNSANTFEQLSRVNQ